MSTDDMSDIASIPDPDKPAEALAAVVALRRTADRLEIAAVQCAVEQGWSWADVANALGVTRQAAHKRHARRLAQSVKKMDATSVRKKGTS